MTSVPTGARAGYAPAAALAIPILVAHEQAAESPFTTPYSLQRRIGTTTTDDQ
jgi:hypothetical protein